MRLVKFRNLSEGEKKAQTYIGQIFRGTISAIRFQSVENVGTVGAEHQQHFLKSVLDIAKDDIEGRRGDMVGKFDELSKQKW